MKNFFLCLGNKQGCLWWNVFWSSDQKTLFTIPCGRSVSLQRQYSVRHISDLNTEIMLPGAYPKFKRLGQVGTYIWESKMHWTLKGKHLEIFFKIF